MLFINKPQGISSFDVCFKLRKVLNTKKIGHTGTLDPNATGVMIILYDKATKANQFLVSDTKTYKCRVLFGIETDTLDIDGNIIEHTDYISPGIFTIIDALESFKGKSIQEVPITSAVRVDGKRLYEYQRENKEVELPKREIEVFNIDLIENHDDGFTFICKVSSGTYIRALVRDILNKIGIIGTVSKLERIAIDNISLDMCDDLNTVLNGYYQTHSLYELLSTRYKTINYDNIDDIKNGKVIKLDTNENKVLICKDNEVYAIYEKDNDVYKCVRGLW